MVQVVAAETAVEERKGKDRKVNQMSKASRTGGYRGIQRTAITRKIVLIAALLEEDEGEKKV